MVNDPPASAGDVGSVSGSGSGEGDGPAEGNGRPLQYPCLENPMDRGAGGLVMRSQRVGFN